MPFSFPYTDDLMGGQYAVPESVLLGEQMVRFGACHARVPFQACVNVPCCVENSSPVFDDISSLWREGGVMSPR